MNEEVSSSCDHCCQYTQSRLRKHKLWSFASEFRFTVGMRRSKQCVSDSLTPRVCVCWVVSAGLCASVSVTSRGSGGGCLLPYASVTERWLSRMGSQAEFKPNGSLFPPQGGGGFQTLRSGSYRTLLFAPLSFFFFIPKKKRALPKNSKADRSLC